MFKASELKVGKLLSSLGEFTWIFCINVTKFCYSHLFASIVYKVILSCSLASLKKTKTTQHNLNNNGVFLALATVYFSSPLLNTAPYILIIPNCSHFLVWLLISHPSVSLVMLLLWPRVPFPTWEFLLFIRIHTNVNMSVKAPLPPWPRAHHSFPTFLQDTSPLSHLPHCTSLSSSRFWVKNILSIWRAKT